MLKRAAYDRIVELLNQGGLMPGQIVSQRELVETTGATLGSIREAIPRLEADGLLQTLPKRGLMVPTLDVSFVRDAYELRSILELSAVRAAIDSIPTARFSGWIERHEQFLANIQTNSNQDAADEMQKLDWDMHATFIDSMQNVLIANVYRVNSIKIHMVVQSRLQVTPFNAERIIGEHLAFLRPMLARDIAASEQALKQHIDNSLHLALGGRL
ncbi:GntR family transcriptional regulator [uncultured Cohaesibacter sp.]|uniref:GntR family transcriptional regulator n=1 Tax=uncultured Cohaesibacter sp. TaxID=1002546 RepID=UPI0029C666D0|nr:GntR family transcriptional regulator [uncultured Cohaesibacter sp.]